MRSRAAVPTVNEVINPHQLYRLLHTSNVCIFLSYTVLPFKLHDAASVRGPGELRGANWVQVAATLPPRVDIPRAFAASFPLHVCLVTCVV